MLYDEPMIQHYLSKALALAHKGLGSTAPNPAVGAVIVKNDTIIGQGYHAQAGHPHAEINALQSCQEDPRGADLYVTLEPCCHWGKTPPCVDAIMQAGIKRVYFAEQDPHPAVKGQGQATLIKAGITCEHHPSEKTRLFYQAYRHWLTTGRPQVTVKLALSHDHKVAHAQARPAAITGPEIAMLTHQSRLKADAILTTYQTICCDDPQMNARINGTTTAKPVYVIDRQLQFGLNWQLNHSAKMVILLHQPHSSPTLRAAHIRHLAIGTPFIEQALVAIGKEGIHHLWVETGPTVYQLLVQSGLADSVWLYHSPRVLGPNALAVTPPATPPDLIYSRTNREQYGQDVLEIYQLMRS